jgi:hypothetical protein
VVLGTVGCTLLVTGHLAGESLPLTLAGAAVLIGAPFVERHRATLRGEVDARQ